jgi:hypothetical protein
MPTDLVTTQSIIHGVPDVLLSGVVASVLTLIGTLGGVIATNWGNTNRLKLQLEHDRSEQAKERLATLRRDLYLKAAESVARGLAYFGSMPQLDFTKPGSDEPIRNVLAVGAQLQLVVNQGTAELIAELIATYGELQMRLMPKVLPIHGLRSDIAIKTESYDNAMRENKRALAAMTEYSESGIRDHALFERLNATATNSRELFKRYGDERTELWNKITTLNRQYLRDLLPEMRRLAEIQIRVMVELRRDLDVGGDIEVFMQIMERQLERVQQAVDAFELEVFGDEDQLPQ